MSRIWQTGAEWQTVDELNSVAMLQGDEVSVSTAQKTGGGTASYKFACTQAMHPSWVQAYSLTPAITGATTLFYKTDVRVETMTSSTSSTRFAPIALYGSNFVAEVQLYNNSGTLYVRVSYNNGGTVTSGVSTGIGLNTWFRLEAKFDSSPADGSETFEVKVNGETKITTTNLTFSSKTISYYGMRAFGAGSGVGDVVAYIDNISVNDANGAYNNSWVGEESIVLLKPNAAGDSAAQVGTYADLNEIPVAGGTIVYIYGSGASAQYNIEDPLTYMDDIDNVKAVSVPVMLYGVYNKTYRTLIKSASGGTMQKTSNLSANGTNGSTIQMISRNSNTPYAGLLISETDPTTGGKWKVTGANSLSNAQIGVDNVESSGYIYPSAMGAMVAFSPYTTVSSGGMLIMFW